MEFFHKFKESIKRIENSKKPLGYFILIFFSAVMLRNIVEIISTGFPLNKLHIAFHHYYLFYISLALSIIILFYFVTKEKIIKISKIILPSFLILVTAPLIDLIITLGRGHFMDYMFPGDNLLMRFLTFFGPVHMSGITIGMRVEIAVVLLASFFYFRAKEKNLIKNLISVFLLYSIIFAHCAMPFFVHLIYNIFTENYVYNYTNLNNLFLLMIFIFLTILFFIARFRTAIAVIKNMRPFRLIHYELMFILGLVIGSFNFADLFQANNNIFYFIFIIISICLAWLFSVITNDIYDIGIDRISNSKRPLVKQDISLPDYKKTAFIILLLAAIYAFAVSFLTLVFILGFIGIYFLYSSPPARLKRILVFSKLAISLNSLIPVVLGYVFAGNDLFEFPLIAVFFFLIIFTLAANFIDIKDYKGDKHAGIKTLPVILGLEKAKFIIGLFFILAYLSIYFIIKKPYLIFPLIFIGIIQFYLINRKRYNEKPVLIIHLLSIIGLFFVL